MGSNRPFEPKPSMSENDEDLEVTRKQKISSQLLVILSAILGHGAMLDGFWSNAFDACEIGKKKHGDQNRFINSTDAKDFVSTVCTGIWRRCAADGTLETVKG
jgi:hypothetical protein